MSQKLTKFSTHWWDPLTNCSFPYPGHLSFSVCPFQLSSFPPIHEEIAGFRVIPFRRYFCFFPYGSLYGKGLFLDLAVRMVVTESGSRRVWLGIRIFRRIVVYQYHPTAAEERSRDAMCFLMNASISRKYPNVFFSGRFFVCLLFIMALCAVNRFIHLFSAWVERTDMMPLTLNASSNHVREDFLFRRGIFIDLLVRFKQTNRAFGRFVAPFDPGGDSDSVFSSASISPENMIRWLCKEGSIQGPRDILVSR